MPKSAGAISAAEVESSPSWIHGGAGGVVLIVTAVLIAWANTLGAPFVFDDHASIVDNTTIRQLVPPAWADPPATAGETVSGRPVLNLTFALNHAAGGLDVRGYHGVNLFIHACAGLAFWGVLRRTRAAGGPGVALAAALLWVIHPLQTAAVTYVVQRAESLAALFTLATLYAFLRGSTSEEGRRWFAVAVVSCLLGVGTKETVAVAPLLVLLYDRAFLAGSFRAAWRLRRGVHAALFATWLPLAVLVQANHARGGSAGADTVGVGTYFLTQCEAIVRYLRLAVWPAGLVFDYGTPLIHQFTVIWPQCLLLAALAMATLALLVRNRPSGFAGACFFLLLAPSSSVLPVVTQTMAEHRVYLALAAPGVLVAAAAASSLRPGIAAILTVVSVAGLGAATVARNATYRSALALWSDTVAKVPANPRAHYNLGLALAGAGRPEEAAIQFRTTLELQPHHAFAHVELGRQAILARRWAEAAGSFEAALAADQRFIDARVSLAQVLVHLGRLAEAETHFRQALSDEPGAIDIRVGLAALRIRADDAAEAETLLREALAAAPELTEAHYLRGLALERLGQPGAAEAELRATLRVDPGHAAAHRALGNMLAARGDVAAAESSYRAAVRSDDTAAASWFALGNLLARQRRIPEAIGAYETALARDPELLDARSNLANCQLVTGRIDAAIANYETVLRARPEDERTRENLRLAREALGRR